MEFVMNVRLASPKAKFLFPLLSVAVVSPASANWFSAPEINISRNVGSAANPTPQDLRGSQRPSDYPLQSQMLNEQGKVAVKVWLDKKGAVTNAVVESNNRVSRLEHAARRYMMNSC